MIGKMKKRTIFKTIEHLHSSGFRGNDAVYENLMKEALELSGMATKKDLIHKALQDLVLSLKKRDLRDIRAKIRFAERPDTKGRKSPR